MARLARVHLPSVPQHIIQRGNDRQACFACKEDFVAYLGWLKEYAHKNKVAIHAWVLMTNHVHILCTPTSKDDISRMMQSVGRQYVRYFNYTYQRTGTLWEGRYKSCLVQAENYLLELYRYIELNPVRAGMVEDPSEYPWSSYQINALGKTSTLYTPHTLYEALGSSTEVRQQAYRDLFKYHVDIKIIEDIRKALNKGLALGNERFKSEVEQLTERRVTEGKRGRPVGWRKEKAEDDI
jgi:REP-associated tyrosine transposase